VTQPIIIITGATAGIGKALSFTFAQEGCHLGLCARTLSDLQELKDEIQKEHADIDIHIQTVDVRNKSAITAFAEAIKEKWGYIDVLINNAGVFLPGSLLEEPEGHFEQTMETNMYSAYHMTRAFHPLLQTEGEKKHIFNMCSIASITAYPNGGTYAISKWAMLGFNNCLRAELKDTPIRVTALLPGATWSRSWEGAELPEDRLMKAEDIAQMILAAWKLPANATVEEIVIRPQKGDL
jgi:NADP-dependent 3-hydroxy acid dehydrogenase YdfG